MNPEIRCAIRGTPLMAHPEELVRQRLLHHMMENLGFPRGLITVEKELSQLPHLQFQNQKIPKRRADILCFTKEVQSSLYPLLLIECKAVPLNDAALRQLSGYNHYVRALFIGVANQSEIRVGWWNAGKKDYEFISYLPSYASLQTALVHQPLLDKKKL